MEYEYYGQYYQETNKIIIKNIESPETLVNLPSVNSPKLIPQGRTDVVIDNVKPGNWNIWTRKISKKGFYNAYAIIYCDGDILSDHNLANFIEPDNWCIEDIIFAYTNLLVVYDKKYYNKKEIQWGEEFDLPEIMCNGVVFGTDYCTDNRIYLSMKQDKIVGIKIIQQEGIGRASKK